MPLRVFTSIFFFFLWFLSGKGVGSMRNLINIEVKASLQTAYTRRKDRLYIQRKIPRAIWWMRIQPLCFPFIVYSLLQLFIWIQFASKTNTDVKFNVLRMSSRLFTIRQSNSQNKSVAGPTENKNSKYK